MLPESSTIIPDLKITFDKIKFSPDVTKEEENQFKDLVSSFPDIFYTNSVDIGATDKVKDRMKLYDTTQFKQTYRRIPPVMIDEVTTHIQELIAIGVCCVPHSPFSSKKVLFRKQDELLRLSELTVVNLIQGRLRITMPPKTLISDLRLSLYLSLATYFFLCINSGYFQIEIEESHKDRTAFTVGTLGFYEFDR